MSLSAGVEPPKQERSRRSYNRILEVTAELLAGRPFDEISVAEIAERAGYTKGAFYHRFDSKATLLRHLVARLTTGALEEWESFLDPEAWSDRALREFLEAFIGRLVAIYTRSTHLMRAFVWEAQWGSDDAIRTTAEELNGRVLEGFLSVVAGHEDELASGIATDLPETARFWITSLTALLSRTYLWRAKSLAPDPDPRLVEGRACALLVPYLAPPPRPGSRRSA